MEACTYGQRIFDKRPHRRLVIFRVSLSNGILIGSAVFTARRYASAAYAVIVCPSVRPSHAGIVSKRLKLGSRKYSHTAAQRY